VVFADPAAACGVECQTLFATRPGFESKLQLIVDHIVGCVHNERPSSMTFAVYGPWGSGKSSTLSWLNHELARRSESDNLPITISTYHAPLWQGYPDTRATLDFEIIKGISQNQPDRFFEITRALAELLDLKMGALPAQAELQTDITFMKVLDILPAAPKVVESYLQRTAAGTSDGTNGGTARRPVHVQLIDDLDRCSPKFTADILHAMNHWQSIGDHRIQFVIAASRAHVEESIGRSSGDSDRSSAEALEKYVHLSIDMPDLLSTPEEVGTFLSSLVTQASADGNADGGLSGHLADTMTHLIEATVKDYPHGIFSPFMRVDGSGITPRAVKHRFNTLLSELERGMDGEDLRAWKNSVIRALWPEFWKSTLEPLEPRTFSKERASEALLRAKQLMNLGGELLTFWRMEAEGVSPALHFLGRKSGIDVSGVDPVLAMYLAARPPWEQAQSPSETLDQPTILSPRDELLLETTLASEAVNRGDMDAAIPHLQRVREICADKPSGLSAATVGNAALYAERADMTDLAHELHEVACQVNPNHYNVLQNYVRFVIQNQLVDDYPKVTQRLDTLRTAGRAHKPTRTAVLDAQFRRLTGEAVDISQIVSEVVQRIEANPTLDSLVELFSIGTDLVDLPLRLAACKTVGLAVTGDSDRFQVLTRLADSLYTSSRPEDELAAIDAYRFMLAHGLTRRFGGPRDEETMFHDVATLLSIRDLDAPAVRLWEWLYQGAGRSVVKRRRPFANALGALGLEQYIPAVLQGEDLPVLDVPDNPLPQRLAPEADAWWETLDLGSYPPSECPVPGILYPPEPADLS
jgi:hypothetical protein